MQQCSVIVFDFLQNTPLLSNHSITYGLSEYPDDLNLQFSPILKQNKWHQRKARFQGYLKLPSNFLWLKI